MDPPAKPVSPLAAQTLVPAQWFEATGAWPTDGWWRELDSPSLDRLIETALANSPPIAVAAARLRSAEQASAATAALNAPVVSAGGDASLQRFSRNYFIPPPYAGRNFGVGDATLDASLDLDFWGRNRAALQAALGQQAALKAELAQARLMLSSAIAQTWMVARVDGLRRTQAGELLAERRINRELAQRRVEAGLEPMSSLHRARAAEQDARLLIEQLDQSLALARNQISALVGAGPVGEDWAQSGNADLQRLLAGYEEPPARLPLQLVGRRPDLAAQLARIESARANIEVARAEFYPSVNLAAFVGLQSVGLNQLLTNNSLISSVGPAVKLPILNGGRLRAALAGREADYDAIVANYNQLLVQAVREVTDSLTILQRVRAQSDVLRAQLESQRGLEKGALRRFEQGLEPRSALCEARIGRLTTELALTDLRATRALARISLIRALGGGYGETAQTSP
jgi:NodT family efflux transporter outer membrane factor (OMF) lipoprotein